MEIPGHYMCPICGYPDLDRPPYRADGDPTYDYCDSCGFQFGISGWDEDLGDWDPHAYEKWRCQWIAAGMPWDNPGRPAPVNWNPLEQLRSAGLSCPDNQINQD